jgi:hypothetical protein
MPYCQEYIDITNKDVEADFHIKMESGQLMPGFHNKFACDGFGFIGMYKEEDGTLMLKMKTDNEEGFELVPFHVVKNNLITSQ